jgi:hypothetical protein
MNCANRDKARDRVAAAEHEHYVFDKLDLVKSFELLGRLGTERKTS